MAYRWRGPLAPYNKLTGDRRRFRSNSLGSRSLPLPLRYQPVSIGAHNGSVDVGSIDTISFAGDQVMGSGRFLTPDIEPQVIPAIEKARMGINGPSVDLAPDFTATVGEDENGRYLEYLKATIAGATLVSIPAFDDQRLSVSEDYPAMVASAWTFEEIPDDEALTAAVNASGWNGLPIAQRDASFNVDQAIQRIAAWAGLGTDKFDESKMKRAYLWRDERKPANDYSAYRLPVGDIIDGKLHIIYHAIYAGAALINGAHGGLPAVSSEEKARLVPVINNIYKAMSEAFNDDLEPPWNQGSTTRALAMDIETFTIKTSWDLPIADDSRTWDKGAALRALDSWAGDDMSKYGSAFLYKDSSGPVEKGSFKFPIAMPIDGKLTIVPAAVRNAAARASSADIPAGDKSKLVSTVQGLMRKIHGGDNAQMAMDGLVAGSGPLAPPADWFADPKLTGPTRVRVTEDGRVFGHMAQWGVCHTGFNNVCVMAPKSKTNYARFHQGTTVTAEGEILPTGKVTLAGPHAPTALGLKPAIAHYDNSTTTVAVVRAGEDEHGIWISGALVPGLAPERVAELRRSPLSGDWRYAPEADNLELIAALGVNTPGFPITETRNGLQFSLVAAGMIPPEDVQDPSLFTVPEQVAEIVKQATLELRKRDEREERLAAILAADQMKRVERLAKITGE